MDLHSCKECGIVINAKKVKYTHTYLPDDPYEAARDEDGDLFTDDVHYNSHIVWEYGEPLETWLCPVCKTFNGIPKED